MRYLGSYEDGPSGHLLIVLELAAAGDLAKFLARCVINENNNINEPALIKRCTFYSETCFCSFSFAFDIVEV